MHYNISDPFVLSWVEALPHADARRELLTAVLHYLPRKELRPSTVTRRTYAHADMAVRRIARTLANLPPGDRIERARLDRKLYYAMAWLEAVRLSLRAVEPGWEPPPKHTLPPSNRAYIHVLRARLRKANNPALLHLLVTEDIERREHAHHTITRREVARANLQRAKDTAGDAQALRRQMVSATARTPRALTTSVRVARDEWKEAVRVCKLAEAKATAARKELMAYRKRITNLEAKLAALTIG